MTQSLISLHAMTDTDFAWLLGEAQRADGLVLCRSEEHTSELQSQ